MKRHPDKKAQIYSPVTVVRWKDKQLIGTPYHEAYRPELEKAGAALRDAAGLSPDPAFANFLRLRADALLTDDYYKSDLAWLDLKDPKLDLIFAPYETYLDDLLGVKASYGASILIRDEAESRKVAVFQQYIPEIQDALPLLSEDRPTKAGHADADGSGGCAIPRGRPAPRVSGGGRQSAERSENPSGERDEENFLQELSGCARGLHRAADCAKADARRPGGQSLRRWVPGGGSAARDLARAGADLRAARRPARGDQ